MSAGGEERFVAWLRRRAPQPDLLGDDTAELAISRTPGRLVVTVDQQIEGTHFAPGLDPRAVGRRLVAVNLSDLAASGARPRWALLAVGVPPETDPRPLVEGVLAESKRHGLVLAGGDVAHAPVLQATLTLLGEKAAGDATLGRDRARPGHALWLGGSVGESALGCELMLRGAAIAGKTVSFPDQNEGRNRDLQLGERLLGAARRAVLRNVLPVPQLALGRWLASSGARRAGACIDVSDGVAKDLRRICTASGVGAELDLPALRTATSRQFESLAVALGLDPVAVALAGGEDYVLLFTLPANVVPPDEFRCVRIGRVVRGSRLVMLDRDGRRHPLPNLGWDHLEHED
ncbi:MAG: thiamine-phosphate kinase [Thermoanaerobaculia bacterium]|nr:thiamine-phosphate kinase [Thermoanaerobaculia bacterium]